MLCPFRQAKNVAELSRQGELSSPCSSRHFVRPDMWCSPSVLDSFEPWGIFFLWSGTLPHPMIPILHLSAHFLATCNCKARYSWKKLTIMHTFSDTIRMITLIKIMIEFLFSSFKALLPTFSYKLSRWVSFCPDGVSLCPKYHHQPLFFSQLSQNPLGICRYLKHPQPHPKTPLF